MKLLTCFLLFANISWQHAFSQESVRKKSLYVTPQLFTDAGINTFMNERDIALSPDGKEIFYSVYLQQSQFHAIIHCIKDAKGRWSEPQIASFSGIYSDMEPAFTPDGKKLFFSSNRPASSSPKKDYDIWFVEKKGSSWESPQNPGPGINTDADEFFPSIAANGNLYFTAAYENGIGREDIYVAKFSEGKYHKPVVLDTGVNSKLYEFNAYVSPDEKLIVFSSFGRKDDKGKGDLYMSTKDEKGNWAPARNLHSINSDKLDYSPFLSFDGKTLFFTSERHSMPTLFTGNALTYDRLRSLHQQLENGLGNIYEVSWEAVVESLR